MGQRALAYFIEADRLGGLVAKTRLASLAHLTSTEAQSMQDTPEVLSRLDAAMKRLRAEQGQVKRPSAELRIAIAASGSRDAVVLRDHIQVFLDLMSQRALFLGDVNETVKRIDEAASTALGVERVSVWWLATDRSKITCADLFERNGAKHSAGVELFAGDFAPYFDALGTERTIAAHDAHTDPRTSCFSQSYLTPLGINSMLDVPIWANKRMVGVICHEHVGPKRRWNSDEETFAYLMASFVALSLERAEQA